MINEKIHYRLPLKLINSYIWAGLNEPAKAILPVLGVYANKDGKAWPGVKLIAELAGYKDLRRIRLGMNDLIKNKLIIRKKQGRHYNYFLIELAIWKKGRSFFPIYKTMVLSNFWAKLTPSEKSLYIVLGVKAKINDPEALDSEFHAIGNINKIKKYIEWAGISRRSLYNAYYGVNHKHLIEYWEDEDPFKYAIYTHP